VPGKIHFKIFEIKIQSKLTFDKIRNITSNTLSKRVWSTT